MLLFVGKCEIPDIKNGSVISHEAATYVKHNSQIEIDCNSGHTLSSNRKPSCFNGTWSVVPGCDPGKDHPHTIFAAIGIVNFFLYEAA